MNKRKFSLLSILVVAIAFVSCDKNDDNIEKPKPDYSREIIGAWDGVSLTGSSKYAEGDSRLVFYADSTCELYTHYEDVWYFSPNRLDESYSIEDGILTLRWRPGKEEDFCEESWQIDDIGNDKMTWTSNSVQNSNQTITSTFNWKKSDIPTDERIKSGIIGSWHALSRTWRNLGPDEKVDSVEVEDFTEMMNAVYTFREDGTVTMYEHYYADPEDPESEEELSITEATYTLDHTYIEYSWVEDGDSVSAWNIIYDVNDKNLTTILRYVLGEDERAVATVLWERVDGAPKANAPQRSKQKSNKETPAGRFQNFNKTEFTAEDIR